MKYLITFVYDNPNEDIQDLKEETNQSSWEVDTCIMTNILEEIFAKNLSLAFTNKNYSLNNVRMIKVERIDPCRE